MGDYWGVAITYTHAYWYTFRALQPSQNIKINNKVKKKKQENLLEGKQSRTQILCT